MKRVVNIALGLMVFGSWAAGPAGVEVWTSAQLQAYRTSLGPKMSAQKVATQPLAKWSSSLLMMAHREGDGEAELHQTQADIMIIESGNATVKVGGTMMNPHDTAANEVRGPSINGGEEKKVGPGDIIHIPAKVPHQMLVRSGQQVTYAIVKVDEK